MKPISITEDNGIGFPRNPAFLVSILLNLGVTAVNLCTEWFKGEIQFTENVQSDSGSGMARPSSSDVFRACRPLYHSSGSCTQMHTVSI